MYICHKKKEALTSLKWCDSNRFDRMHGDRLFDVSYRCQKSSIRVIVSPQFMISPGRSSSICYDLCQYTRGSVSSVNFLFNYIYIRTVNNACVFYHCINCSYSELKLIHSSKNWFPIHYNLLPLLSRRYFRINRIETAKTQLELQLLERNFNRCSINRTLADWIRSSERKLLLYESQLNKLFVSWQVQINRILP